MVAPSFRLTAVVLAVLVACWLLGGCSQRPLPELAELPSSGARVSRLRVQHLRERESGLRSLLSPEQQPPWIDVSGADPYRVEQVASGFAALLRGSKALVTLDRDLHERARLPLPQSPTALCVAGETAWIGSRYDQRLWRAQLAPDGSARLVQQHELPVAGIADVACGDRGVVYVLPADGSALIALDAAGRPVGELPALAGGLRLRRFGRYLLELSLFERSLRVLELTEQGRFAGELGRIRHDGTLWAFDALVRDDGELTVAVAGVEDKPLVRAHGEFENIDSFVWVYRLSRAEPAPRELLQLDVSDFGLVVPKALALRAVGPQLSLTVLAAGSGRMLRAVFDEAGAGGPRIEHSSALPGVSDAVFSADGRGVVYVSPLFDAVVAADRGGVRLQRLDPERRPDPDVRLGEALFFTELMAPDNLSQGTHSRFSCETCHLEGGVDGRTHYTGRADVSVVTKPLFGLANNRPHFSRALDPDLSSVCHNEFRVAGAGSGTDPWFSLESARFPWLAELGVERATLEPLELRAALMKFLYAFTHAPNARTQGREHFSELERRGADAFAQHCASCHAPRLSTDAAQSDAPPEAWERLIFSRNAPLVWASPDYARTGVRPYVHEQGTRVTSLRRLALKPRYFTNGEAPDLAAVLRQFRPLPGGALHAATAADGGVPLPSDTQRALLAFLQLL